MVILLVKLVLLLLFINDVTVVDGFLPSSCRRYSQDSHHPLRATTESSSDKPLTTSLDKLKIPDLQEFYSYDKIVHPKGLKKKKDIIDYLQNNLFLDLALTFPATKRKSVFISLEGTVTELQKILYDEDGGAGATFIRAPVAAGKTTLANYLTTFHSDEFVKLPMANKEDEIRGNVIRAIGEYLKIEMPTNVQEALKELASANKTLVVDEAHIIFDYSDLVNDMFKFPGEWTDNPRPRILLFSVASIGKASTITPTEISKKYMWYPPIPDTKQQEKIAAELSFAGVHLDAESIDFFMKVCSGHRGIFMKAMKWVKVQQSQDIESLGKMWTIRDTVSRVKNSFARSKLQEARDCDVDNFTRSKLQKAEDWEKLQNAEDWDVDNGLRQYMKMSRAISVNGEYSVIQNIPEKFVEILFGGSMLKTELYPLERNLTVSGFLTPERDGTNDEFVLYDWNAQTTKYRVANSLMSEYYHDQFSYLGRERQLTIREFSSGADILVRALPFMSFAEVVDNPSRNIDDRGLGDVLGKSKDSLSYEEKYNSACRSILDGLKYYVSESGGNAGGSPDVVVSYGDDEKYTCVLEFIMTATEDKKQDAHKEHANRFIEKKNYSTATLKALVTIGSNRDKVMKWVKYNYGIQGLEIIGLVTSAAHDSYQMYVKADSSAEEVVGPYLLTCDRVAKSFQKLEGGKYQIIPAQRLKPIVEPQQPRSIQEIRQELTEVTTALTEAEQSNNSREVENNTLLRDVLLDELNDRRSNNNNNNNNNAQQF